MAFRRCRTFFHPLEAQTQHPQDPEEVETSANQPGTPTQYPEPFEKIGASPAQTEATVQHPKPLGEVKPAASTSGALRRSFRAC